MAAPPAPVITLPNSGINFSTNIAQQSVSGTCDASTHEIRVNGSPVGVDYTPGDTVWSFPDRTLESGENTFSVTALNVSMEESLPDTITITLLGDDELSLVVTAPTGISTESKKDSVTASWVKNPEPQVVGYNLYGSTDPGGGVTGYTRLNVDYISNPYKSEEIETLLTEEIEQAGTIKKVIDTYQIQTRIYYAFTQTLDPTTGESLQAGVRRYFVATAVGFDPVLNEEVESIYSGEVSGLPQLIDTSIKDLVPRTSYDVSISQITRIQETNPNVDLKPGTVTRDVMIDPPSEEFERLYIVQDFVHRSQSFLTLVAFDDADGDGISDPVEDSPQKQALKQALFLETDEATQQLIDEAFTKLAGDFNVERKEATASRGSLTIYTLSSAAPTKDIVVNQGALFSTTPDSSTNTPAILFVALSEARIRVSSLSLFFNPRTNRYEVTFPVEAQESGASGNVSANTIVNIVSGVNEPAGVTNDLAFAFGTDQESNVSLATRAMLAFVSLDTGTKGGYLATALAVPNVVRSQVIDAGNTYMERDWDEVRLKHIGGKVDVYIQGEVINEITERFAFQYPEIQDELASVENVAMFQFRVLNTEVTVETPIFEVTKVRNLTRLNDYDLTGYSIVDGVIIDLDETNPANIAIGLDSLDTIEVTYKYVPVVTHIFNNQPIIEVTDVTGEVSGDLNDNYNVYREEDPLLLGDSTQASDSIEIFKYGSKPVDSLQSTTEDLVLSGEQEVELAKVGIIESTIVVKNEAQTITYTKDVDYSITIGTYETASYINRLASGSIGSGDLVKVSYQSGENVVVKYLHNSLLGEVQEEVNEMKHVTADVLVKTAQKNDTTIEAIAVIDSSADEVTVDQTIRTRISRYMANSPIGFSVHQGDIIAIIANTSGVIYTVLSPGLTKLVRSNDSRVFREEVAPTWQWYYLDHVDVYITSVDVLQYNTIDGGGRKKQIGTGPGYIFRHVEIFEDNEPLTMVDAEADVGRVAGQGFIKGDGRLLVSTLDGALPSTHSYKVTYYVYNETGAYDIQAVDFEYLALGELNLTLRAQSS